MKKHLLLFFLTLLPMVASADSSGKCGTNLTWKYVEATKTLTISGTGEMKGNQPFYYLKDKIQKVIIESGMTHIGFEAFYRCSSLTSVTIPNSVTSIGGEAFRECSNLTSVTIPNSVVTIGDYAFSYCRGLTSLTIPNSVVAIGNYAFSYCSGLTSVTILNRLTSIGSAAFSYCSGLTSLTIPNSVTSIGPAAFRGCSGLTSLTIPNSVKTIGTDAFRGCSGLTSVTIPNSVTSIGSWAFLGCSSLTSLTIPNSVTSIGQSAFDSVTKVFVNKGSKTLLALWGAGITAYDKNTQNTLYRPYYSVNKTQTTLTFKFYNIYSEYTTAFNNSPLTDNEIKITGLRPEESRNFSLSVSLDDVTYNYEQNVTTGNISPSVRATGTTATSATLTCSYIKGDAVVTGQRLYFDDKAVEGNPLHVTGLEPGKSYTAKYYIDVAYGDNGNRTYSYTTTVTTKSLTLTTQQPKVISPGNVIVQALSNLDDKETNVGFEWRRTDWTNDFQSNVGQAFLYDGTMEGYIRNLNTEKLWKYRPYYESATGKRYYGEWIGLDPTNTSYFEPSVHTYAQIQVQGNTAAVRGYSMRGSDELAEQGFKYWKQTAATRAATADVPANAMTVTAKGNVMEATLTNLDYETTYCYVAFATTTEGETFYGDMRQFKTEANPTGVRETVATESASTPEAYYDISGHRLAAPRPGLMIIRMSDGTKRKVIVK